MLSLFCFPTWPSQFATLVDANEYCTPRDAQIQIISNHWYRSLWRASFYVLFVDINRSVCHKMYSVHYFDIHPFLELHLAEIVYFQCIIRIFSRFCGIAFCRWHTHVMQSGLSFCLCNVFILQATGLDAWASRVKCPARFVSHLHDICIYMSCL